MAVKVVVGFFILLMVKTQRVEPNILTNMFERLMRVEIPFEKPTESFMKMALMSVPDIILYHGYPYEIHNLVTSDGYCLTLHRIPFSRFNRTSNGIPVYLQHGIVSSSLSFTNDDENSLAFFLADQGYDVWMGNIRGNAYSRNHTKFTPGDKEFWNFSWEDSADYDLPESIDYVISKTKHEQIMYMGHSMGTTMVFAMLSSNIAYQRKIKGVIALGPVTGISYMPSILALPANKIGHLIEVLVAMFGIYETEREPLSKNATIFHMCPQSNPIICQLLEDAIIGYTPNSKNLTSFMLRLLRMKSGTSIKTLLHFKQMLDTKTFARYNYGKQLNKEVYNQSKPIAYDLQSVKTPIAIFYAANDAIANPLDVILLCQQLPNVVTKYLLPGALKRHDDLIMDDRKSGYQYFNEIHKTLLLMAKK